MYFVREEAMKKSNKRFVAFAFLALGASTTTLTHAQIKSAKDVVAAVGRTMGATNLKSIQYSGTGLYYWMGQSYRQRSMG